MTTSQPDQPVSSMPAAPSAVCAHGVAEDATGPNHVLRRWAKLAVFLLCAAVILSLSVSGERMSDSLHLMKAQKMAKNERWDEAFHSYQKLVPKHQGDTDVVLSYAEAAVRTGHHEDATRALLVLTGRRTTDRQMRRMGQVSTALERAGYKPTTSPAPVPLTMY